MVFLEFQSSTLWFQLVWGPGFVLSLKLPLSTWVAGGEVLIPVDELRDVYQIVRNIPYEETGCCAISALLFLPAFPLSLLATV